MSRETLVAELQALAADKSSTPTTVREHARKGLNGSILGHPLIVHSPTGPAMRIEVEKESTIWIPVPVHWIKLEP